MQNEDMSNGMHATYTLKLNIHNDPKCNLVLVNCEKKEDQLYCIIYLWINNNELTVFRFSNEVKLLATGSRQRWKPRLNLNVFVAQAIQMNLCACRTENVPLIRLSNNLVFSTNDSHSRIMIFASKIDGYRMHCKYVRLIIAWSI